MSSAFELMPPAGFVLSLTNGAMGLHRAVDAGVRSPPRCRRPTAAECSTFEPVMPTFFRMRAVTKSSQLCPLTALDQLAGDEVEHVVVGVGAAEAGGRLDEAQPVRDLRRGCRWTAATRAGRRRRGPRPLRCTSRSRTVSSRVTYGSHIWNAGQVADDRRVPLDLALLDEQAQRRGGEDLGVRRDAEQRPCRPRAPARRACARRSPSRARPCRP